MVKRKKIKAANGEILLPEAIIQHIQSFLSGKQAAQTSILSKSWYSAWSTRPNLDFDECDFPMRGYGYPTDGFWEFAKKTMQRYQELNLKIESFRLWIKSSESNSYSLANELIVKAMKMGASDLSFELQYKTDTFVLPHEVLGSETLMRLSVCGCKIDQGVDGKVCCSRLKSISLRRVYIRGDIIWDIISSCPLIENFLLYECKCLYKVQRDGFVRTRTRMFALSPSIEFDDFVRKRTRMFALSPSIEFGKQIVGLVDRLINLYELRKLKYLLLEKVFIHTLTFRDLSSKFPCLKDFYKEIQISSRSLECISFAQEGTLRATFDVPSIRKFKFSGSDLPSLSFETASREWESDISMTCFDYAGAIHPSTSWFLRLNKFLTSLSLSKISLSLKFQGKLEKSFDYAGAIQSLPKPVVENLTMHAPSSVYSALLDGFFWSCRPKFITQYWFPNSYMIWGAKNDFQEILCKRLIQQVSKNCCIPNRSMFCQSDLEEVNVEFFEESIAAWRPLPWKTLLDASKSPAKERKIRFQLKWGLEPITLR